MPMPPMPMKWIGPISRGSFIESSPLCPPARRGTKRRLTYSGPQQNRDRFTLGAYADSGSAVHHLCAAQRVDDARNALVDVTRCTTAGTQSQPRHLHHQRGEPLGSV